MIDIDDLGKDLPENRAVVVAILGNGGTYKLAAAAIGISDRTLREWREKDPAFAAKCDSARAADMAEVMAAIKRMSKTDFQAARFRAERDPLTRDEFGNPRVGMAVQNNYFNPLAQFAPLIPLLDDVIEAEAIEVKEQ